MGKRARAAPEGECHSRSERFLEALLHHSPAAVAEALELLRILHAQIEHRHRQRQMFVDQHLQRRIVQIDRVRRNVHARGYAVAEPFAAVRVTRDLEPLAMRFVHDRLGLLERERGRIHHGAVGVQRVLLGAVNLDPLDAVVRVFPDGLAHAPRAIGNLGPEVGNLLAA